MANLFDFDFTAENVAAQAQTTNTESAIFNKIAERCNNLRRALATLPKRECVRTEETAMEKALKNISFDCSFAAEALLDEIEAEKRAKKIRDLRDAADEAYYENRLDDYFRLLDELEDLETVKPEEEQTTPTPEPEEPAVKINYQAQEITLGCRKVGEPAGKVLDSSDAAKILRDYWTPEEINFRESFKALYLNNANDVVGVLTVGMGGLTSCPVDVRLVFQGALKVGAVRLIVAHNHPSGQLKPSIQDDNLTRKIKEAGKILDIPLLDHLILTSDNYFSYGDEGRL